MKRRLSLVLCAGATLAALGACTTTPDAAPAPAAVTPGAAANMASNCFTCHGPDGRSPGAIPTLHGQSPAVISATLKAFKSGARPSTVMGRHAKGYSDAEIDALAAYIGKQQKTN